MKFLYLKPEQQKLLQQIADILVGIPYRFGAEVDLKLKPEEIKKRNMAIDCSELVEYIYYQLGYKVPDGSYNQYNASAPVKDVILVGDLVFKRKVQDNTIGHVGLVINIDPLTVLEAESFFNAVIKRPLENFKRPTKNNVFAGVRRFLLDYIKVL